LKVAVMSAFPAETPGAAGAPGTVLGMTAADAGDAAPAPFVLLAMTEHVYESPFVRPATMIGEVAPVFAPGLPFVDVQSAR